MDEPRNDTPATEIPASDTGEGKPTTPQEPGPGEEAPAAGEPAPGTAQDAPAAGEGEEAPTTQSFAELLESTGDTSTHPRVRTGDRVRGKVVRVTGEWVFVDLGGKQEGSIRKEEFQTDAVPAEGSEVEAYVMSTQGGEVVLSTRLSSRDVSVSALAEAHRSGIPVEGRVVKTIKGGYEVRVAGMRAFCPLSQIDLRWPREPSVHVGQTYPFRILELKERGRNIVVSRRAILEAERAEKREALKDVLKPGEVVTGTVRSLHNFGAFVDLGGVDGLIPISEMSWGRVESPAEVLSPGQEVRVQVLDVDWERERVSLSLKALQADPWSRVAERYRVGQRVRGTVTRIAPFGAFVELEPGVEGLVHVSALGAGRKVQSPKEVVSPGEVVEVEVVSVDPDNRRIGLSLEHRFWESLGDLPAEGDVVTGTVERVVEFGLFVKLPSGHVGLLPNVEMGTPRGTDHSRAYKPGTEIPVMVLSVEEGGRRIRLSKRAVSEKVERDTVQEFSRKAAPQGPVFGTLGDLLKDKLKKG